MTSLNRYLLVGQIDKRHVVCLSESQSPPIPAGNNDCLNFLTLGNVMNGVVADLQNLCFFANGNLMPIGVAEIESQEWKI